jgi:hypothetical protein
MITAFAECVTNESKKLALSPPFYPTDYDAVIHETTIIAEEQGIFLWYEKNLDIPGNQRLNWFVLYKFPDVLVVMKIYLAPYAPQVYFRSSNSFHL